jgi:hypothetical protein
VLLVLQGTTDDAPLLVGKHGLRERVACRALVEPGLATPAQLRAFQPNEGEERPLNTADLPQSEVQPAKSDELRSGRLGIPLRAGRPVDWE